MSGTIGDTGPEPGPEPIRYNVAAAAAQLGITDRAVRKRIQAGTLRAEPNGRSYWVYLEPGPEGPEPGPVPLDRNEPEPGPDRTLDQARESAVVGLVQSMLAPFIAELGETKEQLGRVTAERDALRDRVSALEVQQVESPATTPATSETATDAATDTPWWQFWKW